MSYDVAVFSGRRPLTLAQAADAYQRLADEINPAEVVEADARIDEFVAEITRTRPQIDDLPKHKIDESPWSIGFEHSPGYAVSSVVWSAVDEVSRSTSRRLQVLPLRLRSAVGDALRA